MKFYWIALWVLGGLVGCKSGSEVSDIQQQMKTEVVENIQQSVLPFWMDYAVAANGGFYGTVLRNGTPVVDAPRGGVLNARILWSFSAAYRTWREEVYLKYANLAQRNFIDTFIDKKNGGVYWLLNADGQVVNPLKYTYAMTYAIYGLAEHYLATRNRESLDVAIELYHTLEKKGRDPLYDGYIEFFTEDWNLLDKYDNNAPKTMNAHLHVLEAYTVLYQCWKDEDLKNRLEFCINLFLDRMYDSSRKHFNLFFDNEWNSLVAMDSYGHDVEAGWLLCEAACTLGNQSLIQETQQIALEVTATCLAEGLTAPGYISSEKKGDRKSQHASWWGQVEMMIACVNAWQITGNFSWMKSAEQIWSFVKNNMVDTVYGEWYSDCFDGIPKVEAPKVSMWRCPYHSVRFGVEVSNRLK